MLNRALGDGGNQIKFKELQLREKKNYMFQSTEVEGMSTAIPRRNEMQRVGGPYLGCRAELEMPRRKGWKADRSRRW